MATKHDVDAAVSTVQAFVMEAVGRSATVGRLLESLPVTKDGYVVTGGDSVWHVKDDTLSWYVVAYIPKSGSKGDPPGGGWRAVRVMPVGSLVWDHQVDVRECYSLHDNAASAIAGTLKHKWRYGEGLRAPSVRTDGDGHPLMYEISPFFNFRGGISYSLKGTDEALLADHRYETFDTIAKAQARCEKAEAAQKEKGEDDG